MTGGKCVFQQQLAIVYRYDWAIVQITELCHCHTNCESISFGSGTYYYLDQIPSLLPVFQHRNYSSTAMDSVQCIHALQDYCNTFSSCNCLEGAHKLTDNYLKKQ